MDMGVNMETILTVINLSSIILSVSVGVLAAISLLVFFFQGWKKSLVRLVKNIISVLFALMLANPVSDAIAEPIITLIKPMLKSSMGTVYDDLFDNGGYLGELIEALPSAMIAPMVFVALYVVFSFILMFFVPLFTRLIFERGEKGTAQPDKKERNRSRLLGLPSGIVNALIVVAVLFLPLAGFVNVAANAIDTMAEQGLEVSFNEIGIENSEDAVEVVYAVADMPVLKYSYGSGTLFDNLTNFRIKGQRYLLTEEFGAIFSIASEAMKLDADIATYGEPQVDAIHNIVRIFDSSALMKNVSSDVLSRLATAWMNGGTYLGIPKPELGGNMQPIAEAVFSIMATTTFDTITPDFTTIGNVVCLFIDYGAIGIVNDSIGITDLVNKEGFISAVLTEIYTNPRMQAVAIEIQNYALVMVAEVLGVPADAEEVLTNMLDDIAASINDLELDVSDVTAEELTETLGQALKNDFALNGVEVPEDVLPLLSEFLVEECAERGTLSGDDIFQIFTDITDAYQSYTGQSATESSVENDEFKLTFIGSANVVAEPDSLSRIERFIVNLLESETVNTESLDKFFNMTSSVKERKLETTCVTLETFKQIASNELSVDQIVQEAKIIESIAIKGCEFANKIIESQEKGENMLMAVDAKQLQEIIDLAKSSSFIGDKSDDFLKAVVESKPMKDTGMIDAETFDAIIDGGAEEIGNKIETIQNTYGIIESLGKEETSPDAVNDSIAWLIENMSQNSAKMLKSQINQNKLVEYGIPANTAKPASKVLQNMLDRMANSAGLSAEEYKTEADAIKHIFDLAKKPSDSDNAGEVFGYTMAEADDVASTILGSKVISGALVDSVIVNGEVVYDYFDTEVELSQADTENLISAINNYTEGTYASAQDKTNENNKIIALAAIFNIQVNIASNGVVSAK